MSIKVNEKIQWNFFFETDTKGVNGLIIKRRNLSGDLCKKAIL